MVARRPRRSCMAEMDQEPTGHLGGPGQGVHRKLPGPLCARTGSEDATLRATAEAQIPARGSLLIIQTSYLNPGVPNSLALRTDISIFGVLRRPRGSPYSCAGLIYFVFSPRLELPHI